MEGMVIPAAIYAHPIVWFVLVVGVAVTLLVKFGKINASMIAPMVAWWGGRRERRIRREARIEAATQLLEDQRVSGLSIQLSGVSAQLEAVVRQAREDSERHHTEMLSIRAQLTATQLQLAEALAEIASLRAELAAYRGENPPL